jgi:hypothetical protein
VSEHACINSFLKHVEANPGNSSASLVDDDTLNATTSRVAVAALEKKLVANMAKFRAQIGALGIKQVPLPRTKRVATPKSSTINKQLLLAELLSL